MRRHRVLAGFLAAGVLAGCAASAQGWARYPGLRQTVQFLAETGDCAGLRAEADRLRQSDDAARQRWGEGNADLVAAIERIASEAGC